LIWKKKEPKAKAQHKNGKKTVAESQAPKIKKPETESKRTIKQVVIEAITANSVITNDELIAAVKALFRKSAFKDSHAAWYRSQARKGLLTGEPIVIPPQKQSKQANWLTGSSEDRAAQVCRETATELSSMKRFQNVLPRYRIMLMRESEDSFTTYPKFQNSGELFDCFREELAALDREHFVLIALDSKNRTIGYHTISIGSLSTSVVHPYLCAAAHK
jgi:hypothetical protein